MPCFHTHWLVALAASVGAPPYVTAGRELYLKLAAIYRNDCLAALNAGDFRVGIDPQGNHKKKSNFVDAMEAAHSTWADTVRGKSKTKNKNQAETDAMTCFSAYMLGACGPDFWMVPSEPKMAGTIPSFGRIHFNLGHYNRAHRQFELSIANVGGPKHVDLQSLVQRSYFLGMATHIAADLIMHQLVNVTAGAYNLLEDTWNNEYGGDWGFHNWNTHNKVEHFWDSYIRYRYLGDYGPFWPRGDAEACDSHAWFTPVGFPTVDGLLNCVDDQVPERSYTLDEVRRGPEELLRANIDGLVVGGAAAAERLLWPALEGDGADDWTGPGVATLALLLRPGGEPLDRILLRLPSSDESPLRGIARGLGLAEGCDLDERLRNALYASSEDKYAVLLEILADRGVDPGPLVAACLQGADLSAARSALCAVRHSANSATHARAVERLFDSAEARIRAAALETGLLWGLPAAHSARVCQTRAHDDHALLLTALVSRPRVVQSRRPISQAPCRRGRVGPELCPSRLKFHAQTQFRSPSRERQRRRSASSA